MRANGPCNGFAPKAALPPGLAHQGGCSRLTEPTRRWCRRRRRESESLLQSGAADIYSQKARPKQSSTQMNGPICLQPYSTKIHVLVFKCVWIFAVFGVENKYGAKMSFSSDVLAKACNRLIRDSVSRLTLLLLLLLRAKLKNILHQWEDSFPPPNAHHPSPSLSFS